jgi:hypothetical protein
MGGFLGYISSPLRLLLTVTITLTIPQAADSRKFVRLNVDITP